MKENGRFRGGESSKFVSFLQFFQSLGIHIVLPFQANECECLHLEEEKLPMPCGNKFRVIFQTFSLD